MTANVATETMQPASQWYDLDADRTPKYVKVAREFRARIESGDWYPVGKCLPSSKSLAAEFAVSRNVILTALQALVKSGHLRHVESKPHQVIWGSAPEDNPGHPRGARLPGHLEEGSLPPAGRRVSAET